MTTEPINEETILLGTRIKAARKAMGYNKAVDFQKKLGFVSLPLYYQWEIGKRKPSKEALQKISSACNVNYDWLATGKGSPFKGVKTPVKEAQQKEALISYEVLTKKAAVTQKPTSSKIKNAIISYAEESEKKTGPKRELVYIHIREELLTKIMTQLIEECKKTNKELEPQKLAKFAAQMYADIVSTEPNAHLQPRLVKTLISTYKRFI